MIYFVISAGFLLAFVYPYVVYPALLRLLPRTPVVSDGTAGENSVAMLFCAYNEEVSLPEKIANIRLIKNLHPDIEVWAYSDGSTDRTVELLEAASDVLTVVSGSSRVGKATGMRQLVSRTRADILLFTDANVEIDPESIPRLRAYFANPEIGTVAGTLIYRNSVSGATATVGGLYWRIEESIKALETQTGSTIGADGSIFAVRRSLYPVVPPHLLDDFIASISPLFKGFRVVSVSDVIAYERLVTSSREEFGRKRRIACRSFNTHLHLWSKIRGLPRVDVFKYVSHKIVRWFGGVSLACAVVFAMAGLFSTLGLAATAFLCGGLLVVAGIAVSMRSSVVLTAVEICTALVATSVGIAESLLGKTYQTWTPAKSRN